MRQNGHPRLYVNARQTAAQRLVFVERELKRISERLHELTRQLDQYQQEARELRCGFTADDDQLYRKLKFITEGR